MAMASHLRFPMTQLLILLLSYVAAIVAAEIARPKLSARVGKHSQSYDPQPQDFPNEQLYGNYLVIQRFKKTITSDAKNITGTWIGNDICGQTTYLGFYCASLPWRTEKLAVTAVIFNDYGLQAPKLKGFIDQLPDLALFHAASNNFGGDIPYLTGLTYNYKLNVGNTIRRFETQADLISGRAVSGIHHGCVNFDIDIAFHIPRPGIGNSKGANIPGTTDSKALLLNHNNISGPLPANIGFSKLSYLALANNKLTGPIPSSISHMQDSLLEVLLLNNQLSGCLPHELGMLTKTSVIDAGMNQLTGPIPSSFSCLSSVEQLNLAGNRLYGQVPDALCNLAGPAGRLANLTLSSNYFTSVGPACSALIKDGVLDVKRNCIPGFANQRAPAECASFLSQPKTCPAAISPVACPAAADARKNAAAPEGRVARDYSSYVTYATLHE